MTRTRRARIALAAACSAAALFAAVPGTASAGILVASAPSCDNGTTSKAFSQWGDSNDYFLAPGGNFETGAAGWTLNGGRVTGDQEPWRVNGDSGTHGLQIPAGHSVVSPTMCVGIENPSMRFFAHRSGGGLLAATSQLVVTARVETSLGLVVEVPVGTIGALSGNGATWNRTPAQIVLASLLPLLPGEHTPVQFRFAAVGTADWVIDDVFVDPRCRA
jgi:hypothetical protein